MLLDACVLINLCATRHLAPIAEYLDVDFVVAREVSGEALYVHADGEPGPERVRIDIERLVSEGIIQIFDLEDSEFATFVAIAARLDDGEAATMALAVHRGLPLATDDRAALRLIEAEYPMLDSLSTSEIVRRYYEQADLSTSDIAVVLSAIERHASYVPPARDPQATWWRSVVLQREEVAHTR